MSQRILVLMPWGTDYMDEPALGVIAPRVRPDTDVEVRNLGEAAPPFPWMHAGLEGAMCQEAKRAQDEGFDGVVIGCSGDPYLETVRAAVDIPVSAPTEAAMHFSRTVGKLAVLARRFPDHYAPRIPSAGTFDFWHKKAAEHGLTRDDYSVRSVFVPKHPDPDTLEHLTHADTKLLRDLTLDAMTDALRGEGVAQAKAAVDEDGADAVYFACTFWGRGVDEFAADLFPGIPVFNPLVTGVAFVESAIVSQGHTAPRLAEQR